MKTQKFTLKQLTSILTTIVQGEDVLSKLQNVKFTSKQMFRFMKIFEAMQKEVTTKQTVLKKLFEDNGAKQVESQDGARLQLDPEVYEKIAPQIEELEEAEIELEFEPIYLTGNEEIDFSLFSLIYPFFEDVEDSPLA